MKKILIFIILAIGFLSVKAQDRTISPTGGFLFNQTNQYLYYGGVAADVANSTHDSLAAIFTMNKTDPTRYDIKLHWDTVHSGAVRSGTYSIKLQGRKFTTDTWTDITTVTSTKQASDTSIYFSLNTEQSSTSTFTLVYDTTNFNRIYFDTTALFHHGTTWGVYKTIAAKSSRQLTGTGTITTTGTGVKKYWYQYRLLIIRSAGSGKMGYFESRFIY